MAQAQNYATLELHLGEAIRFTSATLDAHYRRAGLGDLSEEQGPYQGYKVVDFPDSDCYSSFSRIGVRKDGFQGRTPLYYVRCSDVLKG